MNEERRQSTINDVLINLGEIKGTLTGIESTVSELKVRVGIQNGRVTKSENWIRGIVMVLGFCSFLIAVFGQQAVTAFSNSVSKKSEQILYEQKTDSRLDNIERERSFRDAPRVPAS